MTDAEVEVRALYGEIIDAWNRRDAAAMAAPFSETGQIVGFDGSQLDGRAAIEAHLKPIFADHPTPPYTVLVTSVRFVGPDTAVLRAIVGMIPPGEVDFNPALNAVQTLVAAPRGRSLAR
jgi:uncharacterized protein (TIGR02246 family)